MGGGGGGSSTSAAYYSGNSSGVEAAPMSSVGVPSDADAAAGLYRRDPPSNPQQPGGRARRRGSRLNALDAFRVSEADFLKLSSATSLAGSTTGYLSGA